MSKKLSLYLFVLCMVSLFLYSAAYRITNLSFHSGSKITPLNIIIFIMLAIISESLIIVYKDLAFSPGFAVSTASVLLFGTFWAMLIISLGVALRYYKHGSIKTHFLNTPIYKTIFNISNFSISLFFSSLTFYTVLDRIDLKYPFSIFLAFFLFVVVFFILNTFIMTLLFVILNNLTFSKAYINFSRYGFLSIFFVSPFGILLYFLFISLNVFGATLFLILIISLKYILKLYIDQ